MTRDDLLSLCDQFTNRRRQVMVGRLSVEIVDTVQDPAPEIMRSFRQAEISESEKNALLSLVWGEDEDPGYCDESVCVTDPYADVLASAGDDDLG